MAIYDNNGHGQIYGKTPWPTKKFYILDDILTGQRTWSHKMAFSKPGDES